MTYLPVTVTLSIFLGTLALFNIIVFIFSKIYKWQTLLYIDDSYISARNRYGPWALSFSLVSSALGSWILFIPPQLAYLYGTLAPILYGIAVFLPMIFMAYIVPQIRSLSPSNSFTLGDFILYHFGRPLHVIFSIVSCLAMFLSFTGELLFFSQSISFVTPELNKQITIPMIATLTWLYTMIGGLSGSILSDFYQAIIIVCMITAGYVIMAIDTQIDATEFLERSAPTLAGFRAGIIMIFSFFPAYLIDQTSWQRVWAGKDTRSVRGGLMISAVISLLVVFLAGFGGVFARTLDGSNPKDSYTAFLLLIINSSPVIVGFFLLLLIVLVSSSLDSALIATTAVIATAFKQFNISLRLIFPLSGVFVILSVLIALFYENNALILMLIGNIFAAALTPCIFVGLTPFHSKVGSMTGFICGVISVGIFGAINSLSFSGFFFAYTLPYDLDAIDSIVTFFTAAMTSLIVTLAVTGLERIFKQQTPHQIITTAQIT